MTSKVSEATRGVSDTPAPSSPPQAGLVRQRVRGYDIARALAISGMVFVNFSLLLSDEFDDTPPVWRWISQWPHGRASALFVTLAGAGMAQMLDGAKRSAVRWVLLRRAAVLFVAGNLLITVWTIDILHHYAFYLAFAAAVLVGMRRGWLLGVAAAITVVGIALPTILPEVPRSYGGDGYWTPLGMLQNAIGWGIHPLFPWAAFVAIGLWIGGLDLSDTPTRRALIVRGAIVAVTMPLLSTLLEVMAPASWLPFTGTEWSPAPLYVAAAGGTAALAIGLSEEVAVRWPSHFATTALVATGQMSLSIYVWHALVGVGVPGWAFGLEDALSFGAAHLYAAVFVLLTIALAWGWRQYFERGPANWLLRRLSGTTPPRTREPTRWHLPPVRHPRLLAGVGVAALVVVLGVRVVGPRARPGCGPEGSGRHALSLTCTERSHTLLVETASEVRVETLSGMDLYLELYAGERLIASDDDSGVGQNARIEMPLAAGRYHVVVRPFGLATGSYVLTRSDRPPVSR